MTTMKSAEVVKNIKQWKESGEMTKVTQEIRDLADSIQGEGIEYLKNVCLYIRANGYVPDRSDRPNRLKRTAHEILFPDDDVERDEEGKILIGTCTEWGKVVRALSIAKGIPTVWIETLEEDWIEGKYPEDTYSGHIFLEVYDDKWHILDVTAHPYDTDMFIREKTPNPDYLHKVASKVKRYRVIATGLDSRSLQSPAGHRLSFCTRQEWRDYADRQRGT